LALLTFADWKELASSVLPIPDGHSRLHFESVLARAKDQIDAAVYIVDDEASSDSGSGSDSDSDSVSSVDIDDIIEDLKTDVQCLIDLGPRYKEPVKDRVVDEKAATLPGDFAQDVQAWNPAEYLASRIRDRYPEGDDNLTKILGQANWERAQRLYARKEQSKSEAQQAPAKTDTTNRTLASSKFQDSGIGTSIATPSSYAETMVSYRGARGGAIRIPQPPPEALEGKPFSCILCGVTCNLSLTSSNWKSTWKYVQPDFPRSLQLLTTICLQKACDLRPSALHLPHCKLPVC